MLELKQAEIGVFVGIVLVVFGLAPGLLQDVAAGVRNALASLQMGGLLSPGFHVDPGAPAQSGRPGWLAAIGAALIAGTLLAFFAS